jgi:hypothetical protein
LRETFSDAESQIKRREKHFAKSSKHGIPLIRPGAEPEIRLAN